MDNIFAPVSDQEVEWISQIMGLKALDEPRLEFIRMLGSVDLSACPGSGKTTLILAKLAILAERWTSKSSGLAVLSHTNVAREEIGSRLSHETQARRLLAHPHTVDTIHAFTNKFLVTPWLLSQGLKISVIDDAATALARRRILGGRASILEKTLESKRKTWDDVTMVSADLADPLGGSFHGIGPHTTSYALATKAITESIGQGYLRYAEVLTLGAHIAESCDELVRSLRSRFPLVLLDEMQDTGPLQNRVLDALFYRPLTGCSTRLQRVGDVNQAIFADPAATTVSSFPRESVASIAINNSHRLSPAIARLANHLAVSPVLPEGLVGLGEPSMKEDVQPNRIFVFPKLDTSRVLSRFSCHVAALLNPCDFDSAKIWAVGFRHSPSTEVKPGDDHFPKSVSHYWPPYDSGFGRTLKTPQSLADYVQRAQLQRATQDLATAGVQTLASGILHAARVMRPGSINGAVGNPHRLIKRLTVDDTELSNLYRQLILDHLAHRLHVTQEGWPDLCARLSTVAAKITQTTELPRDPFFQLGLLPEPMDIPGSSGRNQDPNAYEHVDPVSGRSLSVQMGSVHAVKGQTHTATLLLETFTYGHHLSEVIEQLSTRHDAPPPPKTKKRTPYWMRSAFVAMTRPTHSVCLALPDQALGETQGVRNRRIEMLEGVGWSLDFE